MIDLGFQEIGDNEIPTTDKWCLPILYIKDKKDKVRQWQIGFDGGSLMTHAGQLDGKMRQTVSKVKVNTSGRNLRQQAHLQAMAKYRNKTREGYGKSSTSASKAIKPALAEDYSSDKIVSWPVMVQPKLDGVRVTIHLKESKVVFQSRNNMNYRLGHLIEDCEKILKQLPNGSILDGEIYNHELGFDYISGIIRRTDDHPELNQLQFWMYDIQLPDSKMSYIERFSIMQKLIGESKTLKLIQAGYASDDSKVREYHTYFTSIGYEGVMVKKLEAPYVNGRSNNMMKYKTFIDKEMKIIGVEEAKGNEAGTALLVVEDSEKRSIRIRPCGEFNTRANMLLNPSTVIGKLATVKFQNYTQNGLPRFPTIVSIRDYE